MLRMMCKSKIHRATVTGADLNYVGSITIDRTLMDAADLLPSEHVHLFNLNNGARFETYVIEGEPDGGEICLNGAAARLAQPGDRVIVISYAQYDEAELARYRPTMVFVDDANQIARDALRVSSS
ncbi:aspartate 1-decarboxylase [soil metagenome]